LNTIARIMRDKWLGKGLRQSYWELRALSGELVRLLQPHNEVFRRHVLRNQLQYLTGGVSPIAGETEMRARAAVQWLLYAQQATPDDGVPVGYFPCGGQALGWLPSYPETTGYIITSLLAYGDTFGDNKVKEAALKMARWEIAVQMPSGAVQGGPVCAPSQQTAAAFNTGMVLDGWCTAFGLTDDHIFLDAACRAADFLIADLDEDGYFRTNGAFVSAGEIKTYTCLCAWALYRFGDAANERTYRDAAVRVIESALRQQQSNGWFAHNCLVRSEAPLTHTLGYTLQGVLEVGLLAKRPDFVEAVRSGVAPLMAHIDRRGLLAGCFYSDWEPATLSSCLTGNAQIAIVCFRLYQHTHAPEYKATADRLVNALKVQQLLDSSDRALNGCIAGSFPIFGEYMRGGYPSWATKYFLDALLLQQHCGPRA
jgi:hypothetical protein